MTGYRELGKRKWGPTSERPLHQRSCLRSCSYQRSGSSAERQTLHMPSSGSSPSTASSPTPLPLPPAHVPLFRCQQCTLPLALTDSLVSRAFQGSSGPAILVRNACNVKEGERENKVLMSGRHVIASIRCTGCDTELGWRYFVSPDSSQKYKEGKYILEKSRIYKDNAWSADDAP